MILPSRVKRHIGGLLPSSPKKPQQILRGVCWIIPPRLALGLRPAGDPHTRLRAAGTTILFVVQDVAIGL